MGPKDMSQTLSAATSCHPPLDQLFMLVDVFGARIETDEDVQRRTNTHNVSLQPDDVSGCGY